MAEPYPVVTVEPAWALDEEGMGTKRKFWYRDPDTQSEWLFKYPREGTWGITEPSRGSAGEVQLAPSFDHGSSLGRELNDRRRRLHLDEDRVGAYVERGRGAVHWTESESRAPSPLGLFRHAAVEQPKTFRPALERLEPLDAEMARKVVDRVPDDWMSLPARDFACRSMEISIEQLWRIDS